MIIWLTHRTGTTSFSTDILLHFPPALSYFLKDKCPRNTVSWSAAKSGQIPEVIFYWPFLIHFPESFCIIQHFCSNRKTLFDSSLHTVTAFSLIISALWPFSAHTQLSTPVFALWPLFLEFMILTSWITLFVYMNNIMIFICDPPLKWVKNPRPLLSRICDTCYFLTRNFCAGFSYLLKTLLPYMSCKHVGNNRTQTQNPMTWSPALFHWITHAQVHFLNPIFAILCK